MKTLCLVLAVAAIYSFPMSAAVKNGYELKISGARSNLAYFKAAIEQNREFTNLRKHQIRSHIKRLIDFIGYHDLTAQLLRQFQVVAPDLFEEINSVTDKKGRPVDVYVQFIPHTGAEFLLGMNFLSWEANDQDAYRSEYGDHTVSVKITIVTNALFVLAHELGHVKYQVPNRAAYLEYIRKNYRQDEYNSIGHRPDDPSRKYASDYERRFLNHLSVYLKTQSVFTPSPKARLADIRCELEEEFPEAKIIAWAPKKRQPGRKQKLYRLR